MAVLAELGHHLKSGLDARSIEFCLLDEFEDKDEEGEETPTTGVASAPPKHYEDIQLPARPTKGIRRCISLESAPDMIVQARREERRKQFPR